MVVLSNAHTNIPPNVLNMSLQTTSVDITKSVQCEQCNTPNMKTTLKFNDNAFCDYSCLNTYIHINNGFTILCPYFSREFSKNKIGSHQLDVHNNIYVFCSHKCQFSYKK